ncbi:hypothetical protein AAVH_22436 [Aphelenchoides avenae]|nr:hypothetical protein AAVH_22436 [Aphelenchus avenae]
MPQKKGAQAKGQSKVEKSAAKANLGDQKLKATKGASKEQHEEGWTHGAEHHPKGQQLPQAKKPW